MKKRLLILNLEDNALDSELIEAKLAEEGFSDFSLVRVENERDFIQALEGTCFDLVLADYSLPLFDGLSALKITLEKRPEVPFIFVSGAIGEDFAVEMLKNGATDYILKNRMSRLAPAARRALREAREHVERRQAEDEIKKYREHLEQLVKERTAALYESENRYRLLFENAHDAIFIIDGEGENAGKIVDANETAASMHGYSLPEFLELSVEDVYCAGDARQSPDRRDLILKGEWLKAELTHRRKDGSVFPVEISTGLLAQEGHKYIFAIARETSERKKAEETIRIFADVVQHTRIGIAIGTINGTLGLMNPAYAEMHGYTTSELYGRPIADMYSPQTRADVPEHISVTKEKGYNKYETLRLRKDGSVFPAEVEVYAVRDKAGKALYQVANVRDITERKEAEEKIKASLLEKDILLKELYHRTKNNMQVISGLLGLESMSIGDERLQKIFKETQDRIRAMSIVHERLYESQDLSNLDISEYIGDLSRAMLESCLDCEEKVFLKLEVESIPMSIDIATPCGLIINELLSNSLKHAFPGKRKGEIRIVLKKCGEEIMLAYSDNGVGLPEGLDPAKTKTLGLRLVNNLALGQLKGSLEILRGNGTEFRINFLAADR
ncbi:MAG: PAS domain S-box protein [Nitrospiraceae bacterium]|nr:PAS domain S-box protein [Nitrospiraceae bacterium]